jgi:hypothetical protein
MTNMKSNQPEPLNFKLAKITPKWAFKQRARRMLIVALCLSPIVLGVTIVVGSDLLKSVFALLCLVFTITCLVWLIGATHARADTPNQYLDEREIATRNEVYLQAFRIIGALIALGFMVVKLFPTVPLNASDVFTLLFPIVLFLPTCVLAWTQPDPILDLE